MAYADITFKDKNIIKRWLQRRRLVDAVHMAAGVFNPRCVLDFGAGNGELCKIIALKFPNARIICYEPSPSLMIEAQQNLAGFPQVSFYADVAEIPRGGVDLVFCLEVFEHLPKEETEDALGQISFVLASQGSAIIGVPIEIGIPALYKGVFRIFRRFGGFDASIRNVLLAALGSPPSERPVSEIAPGFAFHPDHMGFDYRNLLAILRIQFHVKKVVASPFQFLGTWLNPEVNFLLQNASRQ